MQLISVAQNQLSIVVTLFWTRLLSLVEFGHDLVGHCSVIPELYFLHGFSFHLALKFGG